MSKIHKYIESAVGYMLRYANRSDIVAAYHTGASSPASYKRQPTSYREQDVDRWTRAIMAATDPDNPTRGELMRFYQNLMLDDHLASTIDSRILRVKRASFKFVDNKTGEIENEELKKLFERPWFDDMVQIVLSSIFQGTTLLELFDLNEAGELECINEIPQSNFIAQKGIIINEESDQAGVSYKEGALSRFYVQIGKDYNLGMLNGLAVICLAKKLGLGSWLSFIDKFGVPPVFVVTDRMDEMRRDELFDMMVNFTSNSFTILQGNEKVESLVTKQADAYQTFERLLERGDKLISKRVLGQTGTTDEKSFEGSAEVHERVANDRHESDKLLFKYVFNKEIRPRLVALSPIYADLANYQLSWDNQETLSVKEYLDSVYKLSNNFDFDTAEIVKRTGLPIIGQKNTASSQPLKTEEPKKDKRPQGVAIPNITASAFSNLAEKIARGLYDKKTDPDRLDSGLFTQTCEELFKGIENGLKEGAFDYTSPDFETAMAMKQNVYWFSGAKTYQQLKEMQGMLRDKDGKMRSYNDFRQEVLKISEKYNENYLSAEYDTAVASAQAAGRWNTFLEEADVYPNLKYVTVGDSHVREEHSALEGTIKPINDPFWKTWYPPNGFRCRCRVEQTKEQPSVHTPNESIDYRFAHNAGQDKEVFTVMHPYFSMPEKELARLKEDTEKNKLYAPYTHIKDVDGLTVSSAAHLKDLIENIKAAIPITKADMIVKIRPHIEADGIKNPEYYINDELGDLKNVTSLKNGIENALKSSKKQLCRYTVIKAADFNPDVIKRKLDGIFKQGRYRDQKMIFIHKGRAQLITWDDVEEGKHGELLKKM